MKVYIKIGVPNWDEALSWGDYHFARAMAGSLKVLGHQTTIQILPEWYDDDSDSDLTIHLMGLSKYKTRKKALNVLWIISHPEKAIALDLSQYDLIFTASEKLSLFLSERTSVPVMELKQFADLSLMYPDVDRERATDILFVGNSRKVFREIVKDTLAVAGNDLSIWGTNWEEYVPADLIKGQYYPYEKVRRLYSSCNILLNDHWDDMKQWGFINNRIFDALACKSMIISDYIENIDKMFQGAVLMYQGTGDLSEKIQYLRQNKEKRERIVQRGYEKIIQLHSADKRMAELLEKINNPKHYKFNGTGKSFWFHLKTLIKDKFINA